VSTQAHGSQPILLVPNHTRVGRELADALQYQRRTPETRVLDRVVQRNLAPFLAFARDQSESVVNGEPNGMLGGALQQIDTP
jgi:hypothetical protein